MKRDWQCIRDLLAGLEAKESPGEYLRASDLPSWDAQTFAYHVSLLREAGLVDASVHSSGAGPTVAVAKALTWEGHELLARLRSQPVWNAVSKEARERGLDLSFEVVKLLASSALHRMLGTSA